MNRFFPNIETAIIFLCLIVAMLWGISRCNKKTTQVNLTQPTIIDTLPSPAATRPIPQPATLPQQPVATTTQDLTGAPTPSTQPNTTAPPTTPTQIESQPSPAASVTPPRTPNPTVVTTPNPSKAPVTEGGTVLYILRNGLHLRSKPDLNAKSLGRLKLNDQVYFMNEVTETTQTVRLENGTEVTKPWFKIKTKRGTIGWVHGSGVDFYKRNLIEGL